MALFIGFGILAGLFIIAAYLTLSRSHYMQVQKMANLLIRLGACDEARKWAKGKTLEEVWATCERPEWLLWLCSRMSGPGWPSWTEVAVADERDGRLRSAGEYEDHRARMIRLFLYTPKYLP